MHSKRNFRGKLFTAIISMIFSLLIFNPASAEKSAGGAGMVLTVRGKASATGTGNRTRPLSAMSIIENGETVTTEQNSFLTFILFSNNIEYTIGESSKTAIEKNKVKKISGSLKWEGKKTAISLPKNSNLTSRKLLGMAIREVMPQKKASFVYPVDGLKIFAGPLDFSWIINETPESLVFTLIDSESGKQIFSKKTADFHLKFPQPGFKPLQYGKKYTAKIDWTPKTTNEAEKTNRSLMITFNVLDRESTKIILKSRAEMEKSLKKNPDDVNILMKMMYIYLNYDLYPEAIEIGRRLEKIVPDNINLHYYLSYCYKKIGNKNLEQMHLNKAHELEAVRV